MFVVLAERRFVPDLKDGMNFLTTSDERIDVKLLWQVPKPIGGILKPIGKSSYLTSVLQCLAYLPPVALLLDSGAHSEACITGRLIFR